VDKTLSSDYAALLKDSTFADYAVKCKDGTVPAHKNILWARIPSMRQFLQDKSTYFYKEFKPNIQIVPATSNAETSLYPQSPSHWNGFTLAKF
jgi:hypothetical protein